MEFLIEYGLFLAKTITFVAAVGVILVLVVSAGMKNQGEEKGHLEVSKINENFDNMADTLRSAVYSEEVLKAQDKEKKKKEKEAKKANKKEKTTDTDKKRVYVLDFDGDIKASATEELRESVTAVLSIANSHDEVVVRLESQGGMVHSYGFASSQLKRITSAELPLTVCVDKVAASGGYMMACVANQIVCAPFAVIGSIGVVAQLPNFHRLLKKHDVDFEMFTAGEYKRTVTMFGENTDKDREKFVEDLEDTHVLFKDFIAENRAVVDIESVATGEVWFGTRALENKLVDKLETSDQYLYGLKDDADIYEVRFAHKKSLMEKMGVHAEASLDRILLKWLQRMNSRIFN